MREKEIARKWTLPKWTHPEHPSWDGARQAFSRRAALETAMDGEPDVAIAVVTAETAAIPDCYVCYVCLQPGGITNICACSSAAYPGGSAIHLACQQTLIDLHYEQPPYLRAGRPSCTICKAPWTNVVVKKQPPVLFKPDLPRVALVVRSGTQVGHAHTDPSVRSTDRTTPLSTGLRRGLPDHHRLRAARRWVRPAFRGQPRLVLRQRYDVSNPSQTGSRSSSRCTRTRSR